MADLTSTKTAKDKATADSARFSAEPDPLPAPYGLSRKILGLQHAAGNQAVSQLLQPNTDAPVCSDKGVRPNVEKVLNSGRGQSLDPVTQAEMEARFGHDFSKVRVYTDQAAANSADAIAATAYTVGQDIAFGAGRYAPATPTGRHLLAHELVHVVQQSAGPHLRSGYTDELAVGEPNDAAETAADQAAADPMSPASVTAPQSAVNVGQSPIMVQRQPVQGKRPPLPDEIRSEITSDTDRIVAKLNAWSLTFDDQAEIVGIIKKYHAADQELKTALKESPGYLDHFVSKLKQRTMTRTSMFQEQLVLVYDMLWHELNGLWLNEYKKLMVQSQEGSAGPTERFESGWATMARQEAIGGWGVLKGMGTSLVGIASPVALERIAKSFDESGEILFGKEWSEGEDLDLGFGIHLNARQIGTAGGNVMMQLALMGKGGTSASFAKAQKMMGVVSNLQGVGMAANQIADLVAQMQQEGTLSAENLIKNPEFLSQTVGLVASIYGAATGASASGNKARQARIQLLLQGTQLLPEFGKIVEIQNSDRPLGSKRRETGEVIAGIIGQVVGI